MLGDQQGEVEFKARYKVNGVEHTQHEVRLFRPNSKNNSWSYVDGKTMHLPEKGIEPKIRRNGPCSCESGKKYYAA